MQLFIEQLLNGLAAGSMYALITLGLALIYGVMKILHVAHASVYTAGAYMGLFIYTSTGSILLAFLGSMIFCAIIGVLIERLIYYPLLKYPPYVPLISSIALLIAIEELCRLVAGPEVRTFSAELPFPSLSIWTSFSGVIKLLLIPVGVARNVPSSNRTETFPSLAATHPFCHIL